MKIEDLGLSPRTANALGRAGILKVEQLRGMTEQDLLRLRGIGVACLKELKACVDIEEERGSRRQARGGYAEGYQDGFSAGLKAAVDKLMNLAKVSKGAQGAALQVAAQTIGKIGSPTGTYAVYEEKEDSGLLSED